MAIARCAHCSTPITEAGTQVTEGSKTYCCRNCAAMDMGTTTTQGGHSCAHCESVIVDTSSMSERGGRTFCCGSCANAMEASPSPGAHSRARS